MSEISLKRSELKDDLEINLRNRFIGCEFIFNIFLDDGTHFTNIDYFRKKVVIDKNRTVIAISLDMNGLENFLNNRLVDQMKTTTSFIKVSSDQRRNDYQSKMIRRIDENEELIQEMRDFLSKISALKKQDVNVLILHGVLGLSFEKLGKWMNRKSETVRRAYILALEHLALACM